MAGMDIVETIAKILVVIGGLNWLLVGLMKLDLVVTVFGSIPMLVTAVYALVGLAALYMAYVFWMKK
jgi:hypothetical protein